MHQHSPAAERNQAVILAELRRCLPAQGRLLEIASGTGQHAAFCAAALPGWHWQPSDPDKGALQSIAAWRAQAAAPGLQPPLQLDVLQTRWPVEPAAPVASLGSTGSDASAAAPPWDAIFCANMLHIAPWACCGALMRGADRLLANDGQLITYGPYRVEGEATAPSNEDFDASLRGRNSGWGLRWLHAVQAEAAAAGLALHRRVAMPANNLLLVFARQR